MYRHNPGPMLVGLSIPCEVTATTVTAYTSYPGYIDERMVEDVSVRWSIFEFTFLRALTLLTPRR